MHRRIRWDNTNCSSRIQSQPFFVQFFVLTILFPCLFLFLLAAHQCINKLAWNCCRNTLDGFLRRWHWRQHWRQTSSKRHGHIRTDFLSNKWSNKCPNKSPNSSWCWNSNGLDARHHEHDWWRHWWGYWWMGIYGKWGRYPRYDGFHRVDFILHRRMSKSVFPNLTPFPPCCMRALFRSMPKCRTSFSSRLLRGSFPPRMPSTRMRPHCLPKSTRRLHLPNTWANVSANVSAYSFCKLVICLIWVTFLNMPLTEKYLHFILAHKKSNW